jgi:hypothetical protein
MSGEDAAKFEPIATLCAVDRKGRAIDLAPAWPLLNRVLREWAPEHIQLFGSRARGDVIVYSSREFEAKRDVPNTLAYEAASAGVALYER